MNTLRFIPFAFALVIANSGMSRDLTILTEIFVFFFWIGHNYFLKLYYEKCILEFSEKHGEQFENRRIDLLFRENGKQEFKESQWDLLEVARNTLPNGAYRMMKYSLNKNNYSKLYKFSIFIDEIAPIMVLITTMITY